MRKAKLFRAGVGVTLSQRTTDIQFAVDGSVTKLHRPARYLQGPKDQGVCFPKDGELDKLATRIGQIARRQRAASGRSASAVEAERDSERDPP